MGASVNFDCDMFSESEPIKLENHEEKRINKRKSSASNSVSVGCSTETAKRLRNDLIDKSAIEKSEMGEEKAEDQSNSTENGKKQSEIHEVNKEKPESCETKVSSTAKGTQKGNANFAKHDRR